MVAVWPDGSTRVHYSPSLVIGEHLHVGAAYPVAEFVERSRIALGIASERVRAAYGFPCSRAAASLAGIERAAAQVTEPGATVTVIELRRPASA